MFKSHLFTEFMNFLALDRGFHNKTRHLLRLLSCFRVWMDARDAVVRQSMIPMKLSKECKILCL